MGTRKEHKVLKSTNLDYTFGRITGNLRDLKVGLITPIECVLRIGKAVDEYEEVKKQKKGGRKGGLTNGADEQL